MFNKIKEECGVFAISEADDNLDIVNTSYLALYALQHRGQEGCGICTNNKDSLSLYKDTGLVSEVFTKRNIEKLPKSDIAIAHVRYGTTGDNSRSNVQPLVVNHKEGKMALAHNGNLVNDHILRDRLESKGLIFQTTSDSEVIAYLITKNRLKSSCIEEAIEKTMLEIKGAYSLVIMTPYKLIVARDPRGFRPLVMGKLNDRYVFASETCAFDAINAKYIRSVEPGEIISINKGQLKSIKTHCNKYKRSLCVFELLYFSRPDSIIDDIAVLDARLKAGEYLYEENKIEADVVIGVPDSGILAAIGYSRASGIHYGVGLIKNKYIGRTFIQPEQNQRSSSVQIKLNVVKSAIEGKKVVLIDDSIVRGTTSIRIVKLLRDAGAKEVHFRSSSPMFLNPCYFGTDIDSKENLFACKYTKEEMRDILNVDSLEFLSVKHVTKLAKEDIGYCTACFSGKYPIKPSIDKRKRHLEG
ncbi:MAG: amidophosphoribosyltransferase [Pleomorphochaeta sp.]